MKQTFIKSFATIVLIFMAINAKAYDYDFNVDGIYYNITSEGGKTVSVTYRNSNYNSYSGDITIPSSVEYNGYSYSVTSIGSEAFHGCSGLTSINIPNSVTSIGYDAFYGCSGLTNIKVDASNKVYDSRDNCNAIIETATNTLLHGCKMTTIPNSLTSIGYDAFERCSGLTSINIPNSVTSIGHDAFYGCSGLTSINIPNSVTSIEKRAFYGCSGLTSINIPNSVTSIEEGAFYGCSGLTSITIPNSVTSIGESAFSCSGLTSINIPNSVTSIGYHAFYNCSGLTSINIPNSVTSIGYDAFYGCTINEIHIDDLTSWCNISGLYYLMGSGGKDKKLFIGNKEITSLNIPDGTTSIGGYAFKSCSGLTSINIPNSVTSIGERAFEGCTINEIHIDDLTSWCNISGLDNLMGYGGKDKKLFIGNKEITSLNIPDGTTSIGKYAFYGCSGLTSINIPNSVTSIDNSAFGNCLLLHEIHAEGKTPAEIDNSTFANVNKSRCTLYVPKGAYYAYVAATGWTEFNNIVEVDPESKGTYITIKTEGGKVKQKVEIGSIYEYMLEPDTNWKIHSVTFDGKDMTESVSEDGLFKTPVITTDCTLNVVFEKIGGTAVKAPQNNSIKVYMNDNGAVVNGASLGTPVSVYTTGGALVSTSTIDDNSTTIPLNDKGVYIIKVGDSTYKVMK